MLMMRKLSEDPSLTVPWRDGLFKPSFFAEVVLSPSCVIADDAKFGLGLPLGVSVSSTSSLLVGDSHFSLCWFPLTFIRHSCRSATNRSRSHYNQASF